MGQGHAKLNYGDTNIFTLSHRQEQTPHTHETHTETNRTDSSRFILFHSITDLEQQQKKRKEIFRLSSGIG